MNINVFPNLFFVDVNYLFRYYYLLGMFLNQTMIRSKLKR